MSETPSPQMTLTAPVRQRLRLFAKHEESEAVCCQVEVIVQLEGHDVRKEFDRYLHEADLAARALTFGKSTWDEDDICALLGIERTVRTLPPDATREVSDVAA